MIEDPENTAAPEPKASEQGKGIPAAVWVPGVIAILAAFMWIFQQ